MLEKLEEKKALQDGTKEVDSYGLIRRNYYELSGEYICIPSVKFT